MIGIQTYDEDSIARFLPQLGVGRHKVVFNPSNLSGLTCLVVVGGESVRTNHCYVQREGSIPLIQVLDPNTRRAEPVNEFWIKLGLQKALYIDRNGDIETKINVLTRLSLGETIHFLRMMEGPISVDIECDRDSHEFTCIGFAYKAKDGVVNSISIPLAIGTESYWSLDEELKIWWHIAQIMKSDQPKVFQNFIFDTMLLFRYGILTEGEIWDTMILAHWIEPELEKGLDSLGRLYLTCDVWKGRDNWSSDDSLWVYNAKDAGYTLLILDAQVERLKNEKRFEFIENHLVPLASEVLRVCTRGWNLDLIALREMRSSLETEAVALRSSLVNFAGDLLRPKVSYILRKGKPRPEARYFRKTVSDPKRYQQQTLPPGLNKLTELKDENGQKIELYEEKIEERDFNPLSPIHIKDLFRALGITIPLKDGRESTDEQSLFRLLDRKNIPDDVKDSFIRPLLDYRGICKLISTYCDARRDNDGALRFSINVVGTVTSRFSSNQTPWETGFNSQNLPKTFRKIIIPHSPENVIVNMDIKQADPHMVAWLANETKMLEIMDSGKNLHAYTASMIYGEDIEAIPDYKETTKYKLGKIADNGLNYGAQLPKFIEMCRKQGLVVDYKEAEQAYNGYFKIYPGVRAWQDSIKDQIRKTRTLVTPFGRRRYFFNHMNEKLFNDALAYIPPTTVSDAVNRIWLLYTKFDIGATVIGQCHDSLTFECPVTIVDDLARLLYTLSSAVQFQVNGRTCSFPIDIEVGPNWGEMKKWQASSRNLKA